MPIPTRKGNSDNNNNNAIAQFLTPEAMLTPGVAGSLTMMITNALAQNFEMPRAWAGLALSFIFGLLVLVTTRSLLQKVVFYVLNSLVIFCVAAGANGIGAGATQRVSLSLTSTAFAQGATTSSGMSQQEKLEYCANLSATVAAAQKANEPPQRIVELVKPCQDLANTVKPVGESAPRTTGKFFSPWKF